MKFHLLAKAYALHKLGVPLKKAKITIHNMNVYCGGNIPYTAQEIKRIMPMLYQKEPLTIRPERVMEISLEGNRKFFERILGK